MSTPRVIGIVSGLMLLTVAAQSLLMRNSPDIPADLLDKECIGEPITVEYPFNGGFIEPHACALQCNDGKQRYIAYSNGKGTQCEAPPGCNDWGEDRGITCALPGQASPQSSEG